MTSLWPAISRSIMKPSEVYEKVFTDYSAVQLTSDKHFCMFCKKMLFMIGAHLGIKMNFPYDIMSQLRWKQSKIGCAIHKVRLNYWVSKIYFLPLKANGHSVPPPLCQIWHFLLREREFLITLPNLVHKIVKFKGQIKEDMTTIIMKEVMEFLDETSEIR